MPNSLGFSEDAGPDEALEIIRDEFQPLLIRPSKEDVERALQSWSWLAVPASPPLFVSAFGDLFFQQPEGVVMLDTLQGALAPVAPDVAGLLKTLALRDAQDRLLRSRWVHMARARGLTLGPGECYDWSGRLALGRPLSADTLTKLSFTLKLNIAGQLHEQIRRPG